ncbi:MAG: tRNA (N6-isopentenyl adenosine(37)-C2)-methylthiotransferase MiaB [Elusimicrobiota bacterium]|nr:tRNA (N6-isopentenyl adenosine(37)-C2)-methylthiotransferase MiaB [Elusimicrobiota bacterium]
MKKIKKGHFVTYILRCSDGSLYSGYANDLEKRLECHNQGKGAKYTRGRLPVKLVWHKNYKYLRYAMQKEIELKKLNKKEKEKLLIKYKKQKPQLKLYIKTFGCQMNEADSELIAASFKKRNFEITGDLKEADAAVVNTCTVRQLAEDKAVSMIGRLRKWKRLNPKRKIIVAGCAVEKIEAKNLIKKFPFIDMAIGAKAINSFDKVLSEVVGEPKKSKQTDETNLFNSPITAYITVQRGCSLKCSYCIVPAVRGEAEHIKPEKIIKEVKLKVKSGARELVLLGQTVNSYLSIYKGKRINFTNLLEIISKIEGVERIRFMSPHPLFFNDSFFKVFKRNTKIARHIHLPAQSGSSRILKLMKRGYTKNGYLDILKKLRLADKTVSISTDFIVGYPGETEKDFNETLKLAEAGKFSFAFCFKYSPRTAKDSENKDLLPNEILKKRLDILLETIKSNSKEIFNSRIGNIEEVLIENKNYGRSSANFKVKIDKMLKSGEIQKARIIKNEKNTLYGKAVI